MDICSARFPARDITFYEEGLLWKICGSSFPKRPGVHGLSPARFSNEGAYLVWESMTSIS